MIAGPGIAATKFTRRGKPRDVILTLVLPPSQGGGGPSSGLSAGMSPRGVGVVGDVTLPLSSATSSGRSAFGWRGGAATLARATSNMFEGAHVCKVCICGHGRARLIVVDFGDEQFCASYSSSARHRVRHQQQ